MIELRLSGISENHVYEYTLSGQVIYSDIPLDPLTPYFLTQSSKTLREHRSLVPLVSGTRVFAGEAWVLDGPRAVICDLTDEGYLLDLNDLGMFLVCRDGSCIQNISKSPNVCDVQSLVRTVLGAPLILSLALQDLFCLHAGAIRINSEVTGFLGDSGSGKSTLAAYFSSSFREDHIRISDDILPVKQNETEIVALPHFPQLKLTFDSHYPLFAPAQVNLQRLFVLSPSSEMTDVRVEPMNQRDALLSLIQHSVATRLFGPQLLEKHWNFCSRVCESVPVARLLFPQNIEFLPRMMHRIFEQSAQPIADLSFKQ